MRIDLNIKNIRNIKSAELDLPFDKGMYALVGNNGCGKSTLMLILSLMVKTSSAHLLTSKDTSDDSEIILSIDEKKDTWKRNKALKMTTAQYNKRKQMLSHVHYHGFYEGSIFFGTRFDDYTQISSFFEQEDYTDKIIDADPFVIESLGLILQNNKTYYNSLKRIKSKAIAEEAGFRGYPYFYEYEGKIISQYQMSSGESMLISLIDFINNLVKKGNYKKLLFLIDEVELALHPAAIDRLFEFLNNMVKEEKTEMVVFFSTHSAELIQRINPKNIYLIENDHGNLEITNPCYPNYAVRNLYVPNGFDFVLLVEDELAKSIVERVLLENNLKQSKLCCVLPAGGCTQMLKLHHDMVTYNTLGVGKHIVSIFDGDVKDGIGSNEEYKDLPKCFLPIPSVEKYLKAKLFDMPDKVFIKMLGDKYFSQRSLPDIINDYRNDPRTLQGKDNAGKNLYRIIISNVEKTGISETQFISFIANDIYDYEKPTAFVEALKKLLS